MEKLSDRQLKDKIARVPKYHIGRGLNAVQILSKAWAIDLANSRYVSVFEAKRIKTKNAIKITTLTREPGHGVRKHKMVIYPADARYRGPLCLCSKIKIACDCERWMFTFEVAMAHKGAADVIYSNGMLPLETNRSMKIGCCKHLIKALAFIIKRKL